MVFPGVQKSTWTRDKRRGACYFHRFYDFQPDLNTVQPAGAGRDPQDHGLLDAARRVRLPHGCRAVRHRHQGRQRRNARRAIRHAALVPRVPAMAARATPSSSREANVLPKTDMEYFGEDGERLQMMFNFQVNQHLFYALATADCAPLAKALKATKPRPATAQWGLFLRNHDELDLGRLTKAQREAVFDAFGPDKNMQLYERGIRRRLAPMLQRRPPPHRARLQPDVHAARHARDSLRRRNRHGRRSRLPERNCARTPMQWSTEPHAGFTESDKPMLAGHQRRPLRLRARQRRRAAPRSRTRC